MLRLPNILSCLITNFINIFVPYNKDTRIFYLNSGDMSVQQYDLYYSLFLLLNDYYIIIRLIIAYKKLL